MKRILRDHYLSVLYISTLSVSFAMAKGILSLGEYLFTELQHGTLLRIISVFHSVGEVEVPCRQLGKMGPCQRPVLHVYANQQDGIFPFFPKKLLVL